MKILNVMIFLRTLPSQKSGYARKHVRLPVVPVTGIVSHSNIAKRRFLPNLQTAASSWRKKTVDNPETLGRTETINKRGLYTVVKS